jgi:FkbM family methyltransferase
MDWTKEGYSLVRTKLRHFLWVPNHAKGVVRRKGVLDVELLSCVLDLVRRGDIRKGVCLDIGANIGNHTLFFSTLFDEIYAFEPLAEELPLEENISLNRLTNVRLHRFGLSDTATRQVIYSSPHTGRGASTLDKSLAREGATPKEIKLEIGDEVLENLLDVSLIKIDVEGHEARVLAGLGDLIARNKPTLVFEWNNEKTRSDFENLGILSKVLCEYTLMGLVSPWDKSRCSSPLSRLTALGKATLSRKPYLLVPFNPTESYGNVIACPLSSI